MSLERIRELLTELPGHSLVHGGSHSGKLYQNYPWPPLDVLPAHRNDTQQRLDWLLEKLRAMDALRIVDLGCANGAIAIGLAKAGYYVSGFTPDPQEAEIANIAGTILGVNVYFSSGGIENWIRPSYSVTVLFLSVWKWIVRNDSFDAANRTLSRISGPCINLIFESGITNGGMDLGIGITKADIPDILRKHTGCEPELLGIEPREDGTEREVWRCRRA